MFTSAFRWFIIGWFGLLSGSSAFAVSAMNLPTPEIETLPNGMKLIWFVNDRLPMVDLSLIVQAGSRDDAPGKSGTAELVTHLLDRGAGGMTAQEISHAVEKLGAARMATADDDHFSMSLHGLAPDAETLLALMAKMVTQPAFLESEVKREKDRLLDRWNHIEDYHEALVAVTYRRILTEGTPYARGNLASAVEVGKVGRSDIVDYHKKYFTPKNSLLLIVGRVDRKLLKEKVLSLFGGWQGEEPVRNWKNYSNKKLSFGKKSIVLVDRPGLTQAQVRIGFRAPALNAPEHFALAVTNALLGEYFNSRLNALIRDKLGLTYSIGSGFSYNKEFAEFTISSATQNESVGQLIQKTKEVLKQLKDGPVTAEEVEMAKDYLKGGFLINNSTLNAVSSRWLTGYLFGMGTDYLNQYIPGVQTVKPEDVIAAVRKDFDLDQLVVVVAGDAKAISKSLEKSHLGPIRKVAVSDLK